MHLHMLSSIDSLNVCQTQVELAEQRAEEHAELAASLEGIPQELMTLDGSSSMLDSDSLIDLTDDMEDAPGFIATGGQCQLGAVTAPVYMLAGSEFMACPLFLTTLPAPPSMDMSQLL